MEKFSALAALPGTPEEQLWLRERLEMLSVRETAVLTAIQPDGLWESAEEAILGLRSLREFPVIGSAKDHEELGRCWLRSAWPRAAGLEGYADLNALGERYQEDHPGAFAGNCYVEFPETGPETWHDGKRLPAVDLSWSVRLKLASPAVPEGVWLCLPDYEEVNEEPGGEISLALAALGVRTVRECTLLDARCSLPQVRDLMEQYRSIADLIDDGNGLGFLMAEQGQGLRCFPERYLAALDYEGRHDLRFALDVAQNLRCYDWYPREELRELGESELSCQGAPRALLDTGCIDAEKFALDLLEKKGFRMTEDGQAFILRNSSEFLYEYSEPDPPAQGVQMS